MPGEEGFLPPDLRSGAFGLWIVVFDFGDGRKRYLDDLAACALNLYAGRRQGLRGFHAADDAAHALTIDGYDLNVVFAVQWLQGCQRFCNFHVSPPKSSLFRPDWSFLSLWILPRKSDRCPCATLDLHRNQRISRSGCRMKRFLLSTSRANAWPHSQPGIVEYCLQKWRGNAGLIDLCNRKAPSGVLEI